jgi:hypothetical protein
MAQFSLDSYELVVDRIKRFYEMHPDGRIITEDYTTDNDRASLMWRVKSRVMRGFAGFGEVPSFTGTSRLERHGCVVRS